MTKIKELTEQWRDMSPADWAEHRYGWVQPDGAPIELAPWQRAVLSTWWAHRHDVTTLAISNIKKTGKTTLNAILTAWRWLCLPGEHFCAANDLDQSAGRQFAMIADMIERHPLLARYVRATRTELEFTPTGSTLTALAVDAAGNAGSNHWTASHTEAWGIIYESSIRAWEELTPWPGRVAGLPVLRIADSYAGYIGESNTWHDLVDRGQAGERVDDNWPIYRTGGLLLFHIEGEAAQERCFLGDPADAAAYYTEQKADLRQATFDRLHLNKRGESEGAFVPAEWWEACEDASLKRLQPNKTVPLHVGVDCAVKPGGDDVGIIAVYRHPETRRVAVAWHKVWRGGKRRRGELRLDRTAQPYLERQAERYRLAKVNFDPRYFTTVANKLRDAGLPMVEITQSLPVLGPIGQTLYNLIQDAELGYYRHADFKNLTAGARAREVASGLHIKKGSGQVDLLVALAMACRDVGRARRGWTGRWNGRAGANAVYINSDGEVIADGGPEELQRLRGSLPGGRTSKRIKQFNYGRPSELADDDNEGEQEKHWFFDQL